MSDFRLLARSLSFVEDPAFLAGQGSSSGTPQVSQGSRGL